MFGRARELERLGSPEPAGGSRGGPSVVGWGLGSNDDAAGRRGGSTTHRITKLMVGKDEEASERSRDSLGAKGLSESSGISFLADRWWDTDADGLETSYPLEVCTVWIRKCPVLRPTVRTWWELERDPLTRTRPGLP